MELDPKGLAAALVAALNKFEDDQAVRSCGSWAEHLQLMLQEAIRAYLTTSRSGETGWRLVPVEPTEAMLDAISEFDIYWGYSADGRPGFPDDVWRAMLAASPLPTQEPKP